MILFESVLAFLRDGALFALLTFNLRLSVGIGLLMIVIDWLCGWFRAGFRYFDFTFERSHAESTWTVIQEHVSELTRVPGIGNDILSEDEDVLVRQVMVDVIECDLALLLKPLDVGVRFLLILRVTEVDEVPDLVLSIERNLLSNVRITTTIQVGVGVGGEFVGIDTCEHRKVSITNHICVSVHALWV